jgi:hypothetical protein
VRDIDGDYWIQLGKRNLHQMRADSRDARQIRRTSAKISQLRSRATSPHGQGASHAHKKIMSDVDIFQQLVKITAMIITRSFTTRKP